MFAPAALSCFLLAAKFFLLFGCIARYRGIRADFERTFVALRSLPVDIWLTTQGREYGRFRKFDESRRIETARVGSDQSGVEPDPVAPFIDR